MGLITPVNREVRNALRRPSDKRFRPRLETLESRLVPYSISGNAWPHPELITIGFVPDGTILGSDGQGPITSNLISDFNNRFGSTATWQKEILRAAQVWAKHGSINFTLITDNGASIGAGSYQQGDPSMADIRIGGYNFGTTTLAQAYVPPQANNYSVAGDFQFNTGQNWTIGSPIAQHNLFTVATHEFGHTLGMAHSNVVTATMYSAYTGYRTGIDWDDIYGVRAIYNGGNLRTADYNDTVGDNNSFITATDITQHLQADLTILRQNRDISTTSDVDFFKVTAPLATADTIEFRAQSSGLSLLSPNITVYAADLTTVLGSTNALGQYGANPTVTLVNQVSAGQVIYVKVQGADTTPFGTGKYAIAMSFGGADLPTQLPPNTQTANGNPLQGGGGQATRVLDEFQANSITTGVQDSAAIAADSVGNYVVVWRSEQDDFGDIIAQRFDAAGNPLGAEFRVNSTTAGTQFDPSVDMDSSGNFVVAWASDQNGSYDVFARQFNAFGWTLGDEFMVNSQPWMPDPGEEPMHQGYFWSNETEPEVAMDADGDFIVVWTSDSQDGSGDAVYAQRFNSAGIVQGSAFQVNSFTINDQDSAAVAMDASGNFVVVWESDGQDYSGEEIYGQRYAANGQALGAEFRVNTTTWSNQGTPAIGMDGAGNSVVAWQSEDQDGSGFGIYAQRFDAFGVALGAEFAVNTVTDGAQQFGGSSLYSKSDNTVAIDADGDFVITWMSDDGDDYGIYAQQYNSQGMALGEEIAVNTTKAGQQMAPAVAIASNGDFVVVWHGSGTGDIDGVAGQRYTVNAMSADAHGYPEDGCDHGHDGEHGRGCDCSLCTATFLSDPRTRETSGENRSLSRGHERGVYSVAAAEAMIEVERSWSTQSPRARRVLTDVSLAEHDWLLETPSDFLSTR